MTRTGVVTLACSVVMTIAGAALNYPELVAVGLTGLAACSVAGLWLVRRPDVAIARSVEPPSITEGDPATLCLTVVNRHRRPSPPFLANQRVGAESIPILLPPLPAGGRHVTTCRLPTARRGLYVIPPVILQRSDPFLLVSAQHHAGPALPFAVYPRTHYIAPLPSSGSSELEGTTFSRSRLGGVAFHSLREYVPGDDWRLIHWMSAARAGTLIVRHNVVPDQVHHLVLLDTNAAAYAAADFEDAVRVAASWCEAAVRAGCPLSVHTTGAPTASADTVGSDMSLEQAMAMLAEVRSDPDCPGLAGAGTLQLHGDVSIGVVTGSLRPLDMAGVALLRTRALALTVAQLGGTASRGLEPPPGVIAIAGRNSAELAATWNEVRAR